MQPQKSTCNQLTGILWLRIHVAPRWYSKCAQVEVRLELCEWLWISMTRHEAEVYPHLMKFKMSSDKYWTELDLEIGFYILVRSTTVHR